MQFNRRNINKRLRNGDIISSSLYSTSSSGGGSSSGGVLSGNYLPATKNENEVYIVPHYVTFQESTADAEGNEVIKKLLEITTDGIKVNGNIIASGEVSAYGSGSTGSTTEINLENYYTKDEIDDKLDNIDIGDINLSDYSLTSHTHSNYALSNHTHAQYSPTSHTHSNYVSTIKVGTTNYNVSANTISLPAYPTLSTLGAASSTALNNHTANTTAHITAAERTNWNAAYTNNHTHSNKSVIDGITLTKVSNWDKVVTDWSKIFEIDSNGNLKVKVNLYGQGEISAYGSGSTGSTTEINLENYYTKDEIDDKLDNIDVGDIDLSEYSKTSHTHSNYALSNHTHTNYSVTSHTHAQYASSSHTHPISAITNLQSSLDAKSGTGHSHSNYSLTSHTHSAYAGTGHSHSNYATTTNFNSHSGNTTLHITAAERTAWNAKSDAHSHPYASSSHTHSLSALTSTAHTHSIYYDSTVSRTANTVLAAPNGSNGSATFRSLVAADIPTLAISKISNLQSTLDGKSGTGHSHSNYSVTSHTHNYAGSSSAGGAATSANKVNSTLTFTGGTFATKTFNGSAPTTVNIPTHTSHITNNSGFITTAATVANADKLDGYYGSSSNSGNTYVLRNSNGDINVGAINASGDTNIVGNLCVTGEITAYADGGNATPFIYNVTSYSEINSTATNQVPTANVAYLIKQELEDTKTRLTAAETKLTKIKNSLSGLTSSSSLSTVVTALINLKNNI